MSRFVFASLVGLGVISACGDDPDETCAPEGFADGESVVAGEPLGPFARAALVTPDPRPFGGVAWALVLDEGDGACGQPGPGRRVSVLFCDTPAPRLYEISLPAAFRCPSEKVAVFLEDDRGMDLGEATGGEITVDYAGGCVAGTYSLRFGTDPISGSFDAVVCPSE
ncbi:MAG: hypothetical protein ACKV2T_12900 [Kofleriaceae bacterium]